jgi:hypothetical protein
MSIDFTQFEDDDEELSPTDPFPVLTPLDGGELYKTRFGNVGHLHIVENYDCLAYVSKKEPSHFLKIHEGYAISIDLFDTIRDLGRSLLADHESDIDPDAPIQVLYVVPHDDELLRFTLDQYEEEGEPIDFIPGDPQHAVPVADVDRSWSKPFSRLVRHSDLAHGFSTVG